MTQQRAQTQDSKTEVVRLEVRGNLRKFFNGMKDPEIVLDGPAGTGKTRVALERQHFIQNKYPGARGVMIRRYRSSMNETCIHVFKNEVLKAADGVDWRERDQKWIYPNGSEIIVCGMDDPQKIMSSMYDWAYWNEAIEGTQTMWEAIKTRLRNFKVPYQQLIGDTNPGPPTHWIKQRSDTKRLQLLPTNHKDNPVYWNSAYNLSHYGVPVDVIAEFMNIPVAQVAKEIKSRNHNWIWTRKGEIYVNDTLRDGLSGIMRSRLYDGKWVAAEGQVYDMWNPEIHKVARFEPPAHWFHYWMFDFGYIDPFVWQDWVEDPDTGYLYLYQELYHSHMLVEDAARLIKGVTHAIPMALICDHDAEDRATLEKHLGMLTLPAFKSISPGINAVQLRLRPDPHGYKKPRIYIMDGANIRTDPILLGRHKPTCTEQEFDCYVWDTNKISQDKYRDQPVDKNNHGMDSMRYAVSFVDDIALDPQQFERIVPYNDVDDSEEVQHMLDTMISLY